MELLIGALIMGAFAAGYGIYVSVKTKKLNAIKEMGNLHSFSGTTLYINKRDKALRAIFKTKAHEVGSIEHIPEKYIYTSATVGGITTGGISKVGGYDEVNQFKIARRDLLYLTRNENAANILEHRIEKIHLANDLMEEAKKSPIKDYLKGNDIIVVEQIKPSDGYIALMQAGMTNQAASLASAEASLGYPTPEKCNAIIDWICGVN